jgi:hypothetical protein
MGLESASFCCLEVSWDNKVLSWSCYLDNKVHLCIVWSWYVIPSVAWGFPEITSCLFSKDNTFLLLYKDLSYELT